MKNLVWSGLAAALVVVLGVAIHVGGVEAAGPAQAETVGSYKVLAPIESGDLLLFPVVAAEGKTPESTPFITLDEGIKSGEVEVTEAGKARGLVRHRGSAGVQPTYHDDRFRGAPDFPEENVRGDEVNT